MHIAASLVGFIVSAYSAKYLRALSCCEPAFRRCRPAFGGAGWSLGVASRPWGARRLGSAGGFCGALGQPQRSVWAREHTTHSDRKNHELLSDCLEGSYRCDS
eukprot:6187868-Pleurochrysis_carterae.AAC.3